MRAGSAIRFLVLVLSLSLLGGCLGSRGLAPVDDRSRGEKASTSAVWHTVKKGDTLFSIAFAHGKDYRSVARLNRIKAPYTIYPGQRIRLKGYVPPVKKATNTSAENTVKKKTTTSVKKTTRGTTSGTTHISKRKTDATKDIRWDWPVIGSVIRQYSSSAPRKKGIAIGGRKGQEIKAAAGGTVVYAGSGLSGYGNLVIIKHNSTYLSAYGHNDKLYVKEGQAVKAGDRIAAMGLDEKNVPMLHFEIRRYGKPVNPMNLLPKRRG